MFRAAATTPFDDAVAKATDENATSEDWGAIMEVCDRVTSDANGPREAVQSLIKRLAHRNANVQLYTLELANALSQNCGKPMHRELSSRAFTDALLKLANDRNTHAEVKAKILERLKEWNEMFASDPDLGIMADAYHRLKSSNPSLQPPSAPQKNRLTDLDRQKEEDELQQALRLSLQEEERKKKAAEDQAASGSSAAAGGDPTAAGINNNAAGGSGQPQAQVPMPSGTTAATVSRVRALFDFVPSEPGELEFKKGDVIAVLESVYKDWWRGSLKGKTGIFPLNYVEKLTDPTPDELHREAQMEAEVFAEIKNVEKLLTLLSASNTGPREEDNEEISKLYHQTLAIRPKLIKLIEKYSQKKDDFTQLNEKFIKARRDYEALLESSMSHPPQPNYHQYAARPGIPPAGYGAPPGGRTYANQPPPQQDPQRYFTPAQDQAPQRVAQPQYPPTTATPVYPPTAATPTINDYQRPPGNAPFYMVGSEVPPQGGPPPQQQQQQQYPIRDQRPASSVSGVNQPAPIQTSSPPPPAEQYQAYSQQQAQRPQSTYAAGPPQELSTSVYDSPIAPHNPNSAQTYPNIYSPDDPYSASPANETPTPGMPLGAPAIAPPPGPSSPQQERYHAYGGYPSQPSQPAPQHQPSQPQQPSQPPPQPTYSAYHSDGPSDAPPPQPLGQAPPVPGSRQSVIMTPPPLQPGGPAYDARQSLPSQMQSPGPGGFAGGQQPQYKAYVPPSAPGGPDGAGGPADYYRQTAY